MAVSLPTTRFALLMPIAIGLGWLLPTCARATTFVLMDEQSLLQSSEAVIVGTVTAIESSAAPDSQIYTYVHVQPDSVVKGSIGSDPLVLREPGGTVGSRHEWIFGTPEFWVGERSLLFLSRNRDGTLQTNALAMGKYSLGIDATGNTTAVRDFGHGASAFVPATGRFSEAQPEAQPFEPLLARLRTLLQSEAQTRTALPLTRTPPELGRAPSQFHEAFTFLSTPPVRWFEPDSGLPVQYAVDAIGDSTLGFTSSRAAIDAALAAWSTVPTASLSLSDGGISAPLPLNDCSSLINRVTFNDPFGEVPDPSNCGGILAVGGYCSTGETKTVNGTTFSRIVIGRVTFNNGWGGCSFWNQCNVAEVATHEIGHTIGLGHSSENASETNPTLADATMYFRAHFDGRCASLRSDDIAGLSFIYPQSGTPRPTATFTLVPTATPTRTPSNTPTNTLTPTVTPTRTVTHTPTLSPTVSPTNPPTDTPTSTPTHPPTATSTATPTATATMPPTATPSSTPTLPAPATSTPTISAVCLTLSPTGPGLQAQNQPVGCAQNWQCEQTNDGDSTYVSSPQTSAVGPRADLYTLDSVTPQAAPITTVSVRVVSSSLVGGVSSATSLLRVGAGTTLFAGTPLTPTTSYTEVVTTYPNNPGSGAAWTWADVNTLQAGVRHQVTPGDEVRTTQVTVDVCWIPPPGPSPTPTPAVFGVSGRILYYSNALPVPGTTVQFQGPDSGAAQTDASGQFVFGGMTPGGWALQPQKLADAGGAINALDAVYVLQTAVGMRTLSSDQHWACDVSGDGRINAIDAALILQYKVGLLARFPAAQICNSDWTFLPVPAAAMNQLVVPPQMQAGVCQAGAIVYQPLVNSAASQDFTAVLFGDCTGDWQPGSLVGAAARSVVEPRPAAVRLGHLRVGRQSRSLQVPLMVKTAGTFQGLDVQLEYDPSELTFRDAQLVGKAQPALTAINVRAPGQLALALASETPLHGGTVLLVRFDAHRRPRQRGALRLRHAVVTGSSTA